jgi:hypothetical protein
MSYLTYNDITFEVSNDAVGSCMMSSKIDRNTRAHNCVPLLAFYLACLSTGLRLLHTYV